MNKGKNMKKGVLISLIFIMPFVFSACSEDNNSSNTSNKPLITSIHPQPAAIGDTITISGSNLGAAQGNSSVQINGVPAAQYSKWSETEIKAVIPAGAESGKLWVIVNGEKSNELDFNIYAVRIGTQVWMVKNLDVETYRNGEPIRHCRTVEEWKDANSKMEGAWCYYENSDSLGAIYGKLYNWHAVNDPRGLAPEGWHVPTDDEWKELEMCLGMTQAEADLVGYRGTDQESQLADRADLWDDGKLENDANFGISGFSAFPGGYRGNNGTFHLVGYNGFWWSSTESSTDYAYYRTLGYNTTGVGRNYYNMDYGYSVRCVRD